MIEWFNDWMGENSYYQIIMGLTLNSIVIFASWGIKQIASLVRASIKQNICIEFTMSSVFIIFVLTDALFFKLVTNDSNRVMFFVAIISSHFYMWSLLLFTKKSK